MSADQLVQSEAGKKRHDKERLLFSVLFADAGIVKIDDIRVFQLFKDAR